MSDNAEKPGLRVDDVVQLSDGRIGVITETGFGVVRIFADDGTEELHDESAVTLL
jgi:hypothetical protein